ncbi:MAG TPA: hypothetical protein VF810_01615 [Patescibacteria group bacterium]
MERSKYPPFKESEPQPFPTFQLLMEHLADTDSQPAVDVKDVNYVIKNLTVELTLAGVRLDLLRENNELNTALNGKNARRITAGRLLPVAVALGDESGIAELNAAYASGKQELIDSALSIQKIVYFRAWAFLASLGMPKLKKAPEHSRSRGLMQLSAMTIGLASGAITPQDFTEEFNWRLGRRQEQKIMKDTVAARDEYGKDSSEYITKKTQLDAVRQKYGIPALGTSRRDAYTAIQSSIPRRALPDFLPTLLHIAKTPKSRLSQEFPHLDAVPDLNKYGWDRSVPGSKNEIEAAE